MRDDPGLDAGSAEARISRIRGFTLIRRRLWQDHKPFVVVLGAGVVLRVLVMVAYRPALLLFGDSYSYIEAARSMTPDVTRPFGYSLFLAGMPVGHLSIVALVQHLIGLGMGIAIYALLCRIGVRRWLAVAGAAPVLLDAYQMNIEHFVLAETLFGALIVVAATVLIWPRRPGMPHAAAAGLLLSGVVLTRQAGVLVIVPALAYLVGRGAWRRAQPALCAVAFVVPLVWYAGWFASEQNVHGLTNRDGYFLYAKVAPFADCEKAAMPPLLRPLCDPRPPSQRPGPDWYLFNPASPIFSFPTPQQITKNQAFMRFARRVIRRQPFDYAGAIMHDLVHYFSPLRRTGPREFPARQWQFHVVPPDRERVAANRNRIDGLVLDNPSVNRPMARALGAYGGMIYAWGPLLALGIALGAVAAFAAPAGAGHPRRLRAEAFLFAAAGLGLLLVPAATATFDFRYAIPAATMLGPALAVGAEALMRRRKATSA